MKLEAAWATDVGLVRTGNEDSYLVDDQLGIFAVADGMGGHVGGEVASSTAIEALRAAVAAGNSIEAAVQIANTAVFERSVDDSSLSGMGTTMTAFVPLPASQFLIAHVGDSRAYLLHDHAMERLTEDHSLVEELVRYGRITREQAEVHPQRNIVTRSLGVDPQLEVDVYTVRVVTGDRVMLCSDGLTTMVREREVEDVLRSDETALLAAQRLVKMAVDNGGDDNVTVIVIDVVEGDGETAADPVALATGAGALPAAESTSSDEASSDGEEDNAPRGDGTPDSGFQAQSESESSSDPPVKSGWFRWPFRVLLTLLPIVIVVAAGILALRVITYRQYYVSVDSHHVAIFNGDPDGALWFGAKLVRAYPDLPLTALTQADRDNVSNPHGYCLHDSLNAVEECVDRMRSPA